MPDLFLFVACGAIIIEIISAYKKASIVKFAMGIILFVLVFGWLTMARMNLPAAELKSVSVVHVVDDYPVIIFDGETLMANTLTNEAVGEGVVMEKWERPTCFSYGLYFVLYGSPKYVVEREAE